MTTDGIVSLGDAWPRSGFANLPPWMLGIIRNAINYAVPPPPDTPVGTEPDVREVYFHQLERWESGGIPIAYHLVKDLRGLEAVAVNAHLTISDIRTNLDYGNHYDTLVGERYWRWLYFPFAYTVFWALIFHEPNCYLARPEFLWSRLCALLYEYQPGPRHPEQHEDPAWRAMMLALYERVIGAQYDAKTKQPHYLQNIVQRDELSEGDRRNRILLFDGALLHLRQQIEQELTRTSP